MSTKDTSGLCEVKGCKSHKAPYAIKYCPAHSLLSRIEVTRRKVDWAHDKGYAGFESGFDVRYHFPRFQGLSTSDKAKVIKALPKADASILTDLVKTPNKFAELQKARKAARDNRKSTTLEFTPDQIEMVKDLIGKIERRAIRVASR